MEYTVKATTGYNCEATDTVIVKMLCLEGYISIPNSFTPNKDGRNDVFYIKGKGIGIIKSLRIFNRWGNKLFERSNFEIDNRSFGWDGHYNGSPVPSGSYVYIAEMQCESGETFIKKGTVTIFY
jgi:gliding motility-associated-like protein